MAHRIILKDFQSFDREGAGLLDVARINVIVGPNNSGKSKILRAVDRTIRHYQHSLIAEAGGTYTIEIDRELTTAELKHVFPANTANNAFGGDYWDGFGKHLTGTSVVARIGAELGFRLIDVRPQLSSALSHISRPNAFKHAEERIKQLLGEDKFEKLSEPVYYIKAERDVVAEPENSSKNLEADGTGATNLLRENLHTIGGQKDKVEKSLLGDLNSILWPDHHFNRIFVQQHPGQNLWEILLEEEGKGLVPLSQCGSGLRTLIHLLTYTNLVAKRVNGKIRQGTFLFEELENCLHPHVQRNLFGYLDEVIELPARVFLTTHSSICLDYFQGHRDAVLTHVYQEGGKTSSRPIEAFQDRLGVLDRMGTRASDALQCNAVVWVEGPSDRIFLKRWIELCGGGITEGKHYSILFYGGDLLAHLTMDESKEVTEYIRLLRINRNSAIVIDSDKRHKSDPIRDTKERVRNEGENEGRFVWITKGKEIENYLSEAFFLRYFDSPPAIALYEAPWPKLQGTKAKGRTRAFHSKVEFAEFVSKNTGPEDFTLDWNDRTKALIGFIKKANGL